MEIGSDSLYAKAAIEHLVGAFFYGLALLCGEVEPALTRFSSRGQAEQAVIEAVREFAKAESPDFPETMCVYLSIRCPSSLRRPPIAVATERGWEIEGLTFKVYKP